MHRPDAKIGNRTVSIIEGQSNIYDITWGAPLTLNTEVTAEVSIKSVFDEVVTGNAKVKPVNDNDTSLTMTTLTLDEDAISGFEGMATAAVLADAKVGENAKKAIYNANGTAATGNAAEGMYIRVSGTNDSVYKDYVLKYPAVRFDTIAYDADAVGETPKKMKATANLYVYKPDSGKKYTLYTAQYVGGVLVDVKSDSVVPSTAGAATLSAELAVQDAENSSFKSFLFDNATIRPLASNTYVDNSLKGKKIVCFGDSITGMADYTYVSRLGALTGANVLNLGVSSTTMSYYTSIR